MPIAKDRKTAILIAAVEIQSQLNVKRFPTTQQATLGTPIFFFQIDEVCQPSQPRSAAPARSVFALDCLLAVSYTHLTLPTIYSV